MKYWQVLIGLNILVRAPLIILIPISMFSDGIFRFLPNAFQILKGDLNFYTPPLYMLLQALWALLFKGVLLEYFWKFTSFLSLIAIAVFIIPKINEKLRLSKPEGIIVYSLFLFSTWSLLFGAAIQIEMLLTLLTLSTFLALISSVKKPNTKNILLLILLTALLVYTKQTSFFYIAGFGLFTLASKTSRKNKLIIIIALTIGCLLFFPWYYKNLQVYGSDNLLTGIFGEADAAKDVVGANKYFEFGKINYWDEAVKSYHYFWEIPLPEKAKLGILFSIYHLGAIIVTLVITLLITAGAIKYGKTDMPILFLLLPSLFFSLIYWNFLTFYQFQDVGRHTFPLHFFLYLFCAKFVSNIKNLNLKRLAYLVIIGFVAVSIINAYGITLQIYGKDSELREIVPVVKNYAGVIKTDYIFSEVALEFYSKKSRNEISFDTNITCENPIYNEKFFRVSRIEEKNIKELRICSK